MKAIFMWAIKQRKWFVLWWTLAALFFAGINLAFYPSFKDQAAELDKSLGQIPETARAFISSSSDFFSPVGFLNSQVYYLMLPMVFSILAIACGSSLLAKEEREGTLELLLARPVSRTKLLLAKFAALWAITFSIATITAATVVITSKLVDLAVPSPRLWLVTAFAWLLSLTFGSIALLITSLGSSARLGSIGVASLFLLGSYILSSLSQVVEWLRWPAKILPFNFYHSLDLLNGHASLGNLVYLLGVSIGCMCLSIIAFRRRDIGNA